MPDPKAASSTMTDLYARHFGRRQDGEIDTGPLGKYRFLQHGGIGLGAVMPKMPQQPASMGTYYTDVAKIEAAVAGAAIHA